MTTDDGSDAPAAATIADAPVTTVAAIGAADCGFAKMRGSAAVADESDARTVTADESVAADADAALLARNVPRSLATLARAPTTAIALVTLSGVLDEPRSDVNADDCATAMDSAVELSAATLGCPPPLAIATLTKAATSAAEAPVDGSGDAPLHTHVAVGAGMSVAARAEREDDGERDGEVDGEPVGDCVGETEEDGVEEGVDVGLAPTGNNGLGFGVAAGVCDGV